MIKNSFDQTLIKSDNLLCTIFPWLMTTDIKESFVNSNSTKFPLSNRSVSVWWGEPVEWLVEWWSGGVVESVTGDGSVWSCQGLQWMTSVLACTTPPLQDQDRTRITNGPTRSLNSGVTGEISTGIFQTAVKPCNPHHHPPPPPPAEKLGVDSSTFWLCHFPTWNWRENSQDEK